MSNNWTIREAIFGDAGAIAGLHNEVYRKIEGTETGSNVLWCKDTSWWKWSNVDDPAKRSYVFVAEDSGKIIGHNAYRCVWLNVNGKKELAAISWGSVTHPAYMRQGVFRSIYELRETRARQGGVTVAYAIVTEVGRLSYLSSGWKDLGTFTTLIKVINSRLFVQQKTGSKVLGYIAGVPLNLMLGLWERVKTSRMRPPDISVVEVNFFDSRFDRLWENVKGAFSISTWRDSEYLNWRYVSRPNSKYEILAVQDNNSILGYVVLNVINGTHTTGQIMDFMFLPEKEVYAMVLLKAAIDYLKKRGADIATSQMFRHSLYYKFLASHGFLQRGQGYQWMVHKMSDLETVDVFDVRNWYLTQGDTE